jgi:ABC-type transport system involved in multi-copper enzyme maturation permease subunit
VRLIKSEWLKLIYVKAYWGLVFAATLISVIPVVITPFIINSDNNLLGFGLDQTAAVDSVYANSISGYVFVIILGIMFMAGEFRHGTAVATFLAAPKRAEVLGAKIVISAVGGIFVMLVSTVIALAVGYVTLLAFSESAQPSEGIFLNALVAATISGAILGIMGLALGALIRNQMLAIVGALIYLFIIDPLLLVFLPEAGKFLPSGLITAMLSINVNAPELGLDTSTLLSPLEAVLMLSAYGLVFGAVAVSTSLRRDID